MVSVPCNPAFNFVTQLAARATLEQSVTH